MKRIATLSALLLMILAIGASAQPTWPQNLNWLGYTYTNATAIQDPQDVNNNQSAFDLVYDAAYNAPYTVQLAATSTAVYFRLQVRSITDWTVGTYILFIADQNGTVLGKTYLTLTGNAGSIHVVDVANALAQQTASGSHNSNIGGWARIVPISNSTHSYVDFQVPRGVFESVLQIVGPVSLKFYAGTSTGAGNINNVNTDWMTPSTSGVPTAADFSALGYGTLEGISNGISPLPVELTSFTAYLKSGTVSLSWNTATEINNFGFEIERRSGSGEWMTIGFVAGHGNSSSPRSYSFSDDVASLRGAVSYRLKQIDRDGTTEYSSTVMVNQNAAGTVDVISAYPNPFNPTTTVNFTLAAASTVQLGLHDITGREVKSILNGAVLGEGAHSQTVNADGLPSGRYFLVLQTAAGSSIYPVLLSK